MSFFDKFKKPATEKPAPQEQASMQPTATDVHSALTKTLETVGPTLSGHSSEIFNNLHQLTSRPAAEGQATEFLATIQSFVEQMPAEDQQMFRAEFNTQMNNALGSEDSMQEAA